MPWISEIAFRLTFKIHKEEMDSKRGIQENRRQWMLCSSITPSENSFQVFKWKSNPKDDDSITIATHAIFLSGCSVY
jgi:hypothetical protein